MAGKVASHLKNAILRVNHIGRLLPWLALLKRCGMFGVQHCHTSQKAVSHTAVTFQYTLSSHSEAFSFLFFQEKEGYFSL
jgi:hypothetical protein